jgi:hypothetical protein
MLFKGQNVWRPETIKKLIMRARRETEDWL